MSFLKNNLLLASFFIVACDQIQASISIDSDTIAKIWQDGINFAAEESMDKSVTPFIQNDPTVRDKGFAKIVAGTGVLIGESYVVQKNVATNLVRNTGWSLFYSGMYDLLWPWPRKELVLDESATVFAINRVIKPIVIDTVVSNSSYSRAQSQIAVNSAQVITSTYMLYNQDPRIVRISRKVRLDGVKDTVYGGLYCLRDDFEKFCLKTNENN